MDLSAEQLEELSEKLKQELGLGVSPFSPAISAFYEGAQRKHNLETLRHLAIFGDMVLLLNGASGAGKTRLLEEFSRRYGEEINVLMLSALAGATKQSCLTRLALLSGIQVIENEPAAQILSRLIQKYEVDFEKTGKRAIWVIDDADQLSDPELSLFYSAFSALPTESAVVLMMSGSSELATKLTSNLPVERHDQFHQVMLKPFSEDETIEYAEMRLRAAGYQRSLDFTPQQREKLVQLGKGLPGLIHQCFAAVLFEVEEQSEAVEKEGQNTGQNILFALAGLLLFSFIFVSYQHGLFGSDDKANHVEQVASNEAFVRERGDLAEERDRAAKEAAERLAMLDRVIAEQSQSFPDSLEVEAVQGEASQKDQNIPQVSESSVVDETERPIMPSEQVSPESPEVGASNGDLIAEEMQEQPREHEVEGGGASQPETVVEKIESRHPGFRTGDWVRGNLTAYTLQVLGSYNEDTAKRFTESVQGLNGEVVYIESLYKNKPWYVVLYGSFESKELARKAIKEAPNQIKKQKPWLRSFEAIADSLP